MQNQPVTREVRPLSEAMFGAEVLPFVRRRRRRIDAAAAALIALVARQRKVALAQLLNASRGSPEVAETRQLAMYLTHVLLGRTYAEVGSVFGRDRTTVSHACAHIEDLRDSPDFDAEVMRIEARLAAPTVAEREPQHAAG